MEMCSSDHEEIVYEPGGGLYRGKCPMCEAKERIGELETIIEDAKSTLSDMESELKAKIEESKRSEADA